jgi:hypothetical protein
LSSKAIPCARRPFGPKSLVELCKATATVERRFQQPQELAPGRLLVDRLDNFRIGRRVGPQGATRCGDLGDLLVGGDRRMPLTQSPVELRLLRTVPDERHGFARDPLQILPAPGLGVELAEYQGDVDDVEGLAQFDQVLAGLLEKLDRLLALAGSSQDEPQQVAELGVGHRLFPVAVAFRRQTARRSGPPGFGEPPQDFAEKLCGRMQRLRECRSEIVDSAIESLVPLLKVAVKEYESPVEVGLVKRFFEPLV